MGKCVENKKEKVRGRRTVKKVKEWLKAKVNTKGTRKIARTPKPNEKCMMLENSREKLDATPVTVYQVDRTLGWNYYDWVD